MMHIPAARLEAVHDPAGWHGKDLLSNPDWITQLSKQQCDDLAAMADSHANQIDSLDKLIALRGASFNLGSALSTALK